MSHTCQETTGMIGNEYLQCGAPAVALIQHRGRHEGPYYMCLGCANHNIHNRNADLVAWFDEPVFDTKRSHDDAKQI